MCYIHHTPNDSLESFVGDKAEDCHPMLFSDADFAGDQVTAKSTSGLYLAIVGPNTYAPITASCKKQTCVSHSSTESEIVAAEQGIRCEGLQALTFWENVVALLSDKPVQLAETPAQPNALELNPYSERFDPGKYFAYTQKAAQTTVLIVAEDNEAVIKIIAKGRSMALRHLPRTHRIDIHWLIEVCANPRVKLLYVNTKQQVADLMTKAINKPETWQHLLDIAQIRPGPEKQGDLKKPSSAALGISHPPGLSIPFQASECRTCGFHIAAASACMCDWT
jgi:hypothetical protein